MVKHPGADESTEHAEVTEERCACADGFQWPCSAQRHGHLFRGKPTSGKAAAIILPQMGEVGIARWDLVKSRMAGFMVRSGPIRRVGPQSEPPGWRTRVVASPGTFAMLTGQVDLLHVRQR